MKTRDSALGNKSEGELNTRVGPFGFPLQAAASNVHELVCDLLTERCWRQAF